MRPPLAQPLEMNHDGIAQLCRAHGVERLEVFGSAANGRFDPQRSDFDFIVTFAADDSASLSSRFFGLCDGLEQLLGRHVDLMTNQPIRNPYFRREVDVSRRVLYERAPAETPG